jgi:probable HAF family extracellular repeat protein
MNSNAFFSVAGRDGHYGINRLNPGVHGIRRRGARAAGPTLGCRVAAFIAGLLALSCTAAAWAQDAEFIPLGDLPGGDFFSSAYDVSDDGGVVVGGGRSELGPEATIWTAATGMQAMAPPGADYSLGGAVAVSGDGRVVAGNGVYEGVVQPFRWTAAGGVEWLGGFSGGQADTRPNGASGDGGVVVGEVRGARPEAFRWDAASGFVGLGDLDGGIFYSRAAAVSAGGSVVVGTSVVEGDSCYEAFRWTQQAGMVGIGYLPGGEVCPQGQPVPGGGFGSRALAVSGDGRVIVGRSRSSNADPERQEAFRWTEAGGIIGLGDLPGGDFGSVAEGVSDDGNVIVGAARTEIGDEAFVWTPEKGMQRLQDVLADGGATGLEGWRFWVAYAVSPNGRWVVGTGDSPNGEFEAFLARLPASLVGGFRINPGLNDAWYNPDTSGQGFLISAFPVIQQMFVAWFTFDTQRPPEDVTALLGEPGHRWLTAQGPYNGDTAELTIYVTEGGVFDSIEPAAETDLGGDGTLTIEFADCTQALVSYHITSLAISGQIPIERITPDNVQLCESLQAE